MESYLPLIIQLVAGLIGGNAAGSVLKDKSLGTTGNSVAGAVGGVILGWILNAIMPGAGGDAAATASNLDLSGILTSVIGGGAGGAVLTAILGMLKDRFASAR